MAFDDLDAVGSRGADAAVQTGRDGLSEDDTPEVHRVPTVSASMPVNLVASGWIPPEVSHPAVMATAKLLA